MSENKNFKDLLKEIENDNISGLSAAYAPHKFSKYFECKALSVCRGESITVKHRKRIPLWAAVLIVLLLAAMITGCAVAIYHNFFRSIPFIGVADQNDDVVLYSTTEHVVLKDLEVETVLLLKENNSVRFMMWGAIDYWDDFWDVRNSEPVARIICGDSVIDMYCRSASISADAKSAVYAEASVSGIDPKKNMKLIYQGIEKELEFTDISSKGYEVSEWAVVEGITLKILPIYTNNRFLLLEAEGLENALVSAALTLHDSEGNTVACNGAEIIDDRYYLLTAKDNLPGDIVKIEINHIRIQQKTETQEFIIPLPEDNTEQDINVALFKTALFYDTAAHIRRDGKYVYLTTTVLPDADTKFRDFMLHYDIGISTETYCLEYGDDGAEINTYKIEIPEDAKELHIKCNDYNCMMFGGDEPLAEIIIKKK